MKTKSNKLAALIGFALILMLSILTVPQISTAATGEEIVREANNALQNLYQTTPIAKQMAGMAKGILVFPEVIKAGFILGGQYGEGVLFVGGKPTAFFNTIAASWGLQAGAQSFGYALFFLDNESLKYLKKSKGWELGVGPTIVVMDKGAASSFTTSTAQKGIYAFFFDQQGLMAGLGIQGSKITQFTPAK